MPGQRNVKYYEPEQVVPWIDIAFHINIRRRPLYYTFNLIVPSVILYVPSTSLFLSFELHDKFYPLHRSSISLLSFTLPVESSEKISLGLP